MGEFCNLSFEEEGGNGHGVLTSCGDFFLKKGGIKE